MKIDYKVCFFFAYAYVKPEGDSEVRLFNMVKGLAYVPLVGAIAQIIFMVHLGNPPKNILGEYVAFSSRLCVSLVCPLVLPLIDAVATIWFAIDEKRKKAG